MTTPFTTPAPQVIVTNWGAVLVRGILAILFGLVAVFLPLPTVAALALLFGAYAFVDGVFALAAAFRGGRAGHGWAVALEGVLGILVGLFTFFRPLTTALFLVYLIAAWAIVTGVLEVVTAIRFRKVMTGEGWLALAGVASIVVGVLLAIAPAAGAVAIALWLGIYAIIFGIMLVVLALRLRGWRGRATAHTATV